MNDNIRRIVMLCTILTVGLIFIFFDVTLVQLFCIMVVIVIVLPFLLGIATVAEVRTTLRNMSRTGILKRLNEMKFFEKTSSPQELKPAPKPDKARQKTVNPEAPKTAGTPGGLPTHLKSMVSSFSSLGTIFRERSRREKKVEDINRMLDKTVSERVTRSPAPAAAKGGSGGNNSLPAPGGGAGFDDNTDPFLSLSSDEFDAGLLDGLDDGPVQPLSTAVPEPGGGPASFEDLLEPELSMPSLENMGEPASPPGDPASGPDVFSGLGEGDSMDADFGDLDNLSLDDVEPDETNGAAAPAAPASATPVAAAPAPPEVPQPGSSAIKTAWIPSDAPIGADQPEDQLGVQSDMASFAGGVAGTDEDLLSSIASDVRTVKKEKDVSLLRELKDFKAPASEIEQELQTMYQKIGVVQTTKEKNPPPAKGMK